MLEWAQNKKVAIYFDKIPDVRIRYYVFNKNISKSENERRRKNIEKYPFICMKSLLVKIVDKKKNKEYQFNIKERYCYDGASIPKAFFRIIGANTDNRFLIPALVHDILCENHNYIDNNRKLSSEVFNVLLEENEVFPFKRFLMKHSVNTFQIFCKWGK